MGQGNHETYIIDPDDNEEGEGELIPFHPRFRGRAPAGEDSEEPDPKRPKPNSNGNVDNPGGGSVMALAAPSAGKTNPIGEETGVTPIPFRRSRKSPFDSTTQAILPYTSLKTAQSCALGTGADSVVVKQFRLNSIYDCESTHSYAAITTPTADSADATVNLPMWRAWYTRFYNYWTVVGCEWSVSLLQTATKEYGQLEAFVYFHGVQQPPVVDTAGTPVRIPKDFRIQHPGVMYKRLKGQPEGTGVRYPAYEAKNWTTFSGFWTPGKIHHEVVEDELQQTWHKGLEVPPTPEFMTIMVQRSDESTNAAMTFDMYVTLKYHTQFKDLLATYQYITPTTSVAALDNFIPKVN